MKNLLTILLLGWSLPTLADRLPLPSGTPASYKSECGSCHLPYPPALLAADDWRRIMGKLGDHFGSDATLDSRQQQEIRAFLENAAGRPERLGSAGEPPRISQTQRFIRKHREVPARFWSDPRVKSAANCEACHPGAATGNYSEHDIAFRELRK
ncbi:cytochrome C [Dechloromonas sp. ARDL1]|jgi:hypothetical protein|uniref:diheme cytochrome c n=1 Tax=Dechloromonas sp. ARDL1 TaxID=3322121 RepID=UPI003DA77364